MKLHILDSAASSEHLLRETTVHGRDEAGLLGADTKTGGVVILLDAEKEVLHLIVRAQHHMLPQQRLGFLPPDRAHEGSAAKEVETLPGFVGELVGAILDGRSVSENEVDDV